MDTYSAEVVRVVTAARALLQMVMPDPLVAQLFLSPVQ
jgi:hypothetical protein